jgi:hypothetical protein
MGTETLGLEGAKRDSSAAFGVAPPKRGILEVREYAEYVELADFALEVDLLEELVVVFEVEVDKVDEVLGTAATTADVDVERGIGLGAPSVGSLDGLFDSIGIAVCSTIAGSDDVGIGIAIGTGLAVPTGVFVDTGMGIGTAFGAPSGVYWDIGTAIGTAVACSVDSEVEISFPLFGRGARGKDGNPGLSKGRLPLCGPARCGCPALPLSSPARPAKPPSPSLALSLSLYPPIPRGSCGPKPGSSRNGIPLYGPGEYGPASYGPPGN